MANYPTTVFSPTTKNAGDTIAASHVNDLQAEVTAVETALLTSGLAHVLTVNKFGTHTFNAGGTGGNTLSVRNTTSGTGNYASLNLGGDVDSGLVALATSSAYTGGYGASAGVLDATLAGGMVLYASHASGVIKFASGGTTERGRFETTGYLQLAVGLVMTTWPTTASAANAFVSDADYLRRSTSSLRYKTDVERLDAAQAKAVIASLRPITYRGIHDGPTRFAGFAAEEVAAVDPMLATFDKQGRPDYVMYDRIPAYLVPVVQDLDRRLSVLEMR